MITAKKRARKLRFFSLFTLCLLLAGLVIACSGIRGEVSAEPIEPLKKKTLTEGLNSEESYQKGYDDAMAAAEKALEKLVDELAGIVYKKITYPAAARKAGETGKFDFLISVDDKGEITNSSYSQEASEKDPSGEVTVVGFGEANGEKIGNSAILVEEVLKVLDGLQLPEPFKIMDIPMPAKLTIRFNFILEE